MRLISTPSLARFFIFNCIAFSTAVAQSHTWTIGNHEVERTMSFSSSGLVTERWSDLKTRTDFITPKDLKAELAPEFSFQCNGSSYSGHGADFDFVSADEAALPNGRSLTIRLRGHQLPLDISLVYSVYDGQPAIRKRLVLRNTGSVPLHLSHLDIETIAPSVGPASETLLNTQYGAIPREIFYTGRSEDAALLIANGRTGVGFAVISEVPGYMKRTEVDGWFDAEHVGIHVLYDTDLMPFARTLAPGEEFTTAAVSTITFKKGDGFRDPQWVLPSYTAKVLMRRVDAQGAPWIYNTWEPFQRSLTRDLVLSLIDAAGNMGMDVFTIDDGWQEEYGDNAVNLKAFPGGLKLIQDAVEKRGMRLGLWVPMAAIGTSTEEYRAHPEWSAIDLEGKQKTTGTMAGQKVVMCLASPFRNEAAARINQLIEQYNLAYVKLDLTTIFNAYGEAPGCWAKGHDHGSWAESLNRTYEGIAYVTSKVYAKHPDVLLDLTFELWGQKHVIDAGLLAAGDLDWMSNVDDNQPNSAGLLQARTLLYQRAVSMPAESMLIGNIHGELPNIQESFATEIGSAPLLLGDLRNLSATDQQWYREKIGWFKKLRATTKISESFFPLGSWLQPSPATWDGFARLAHSGNGVIVVFRNKSHLSAANVQLPLIPEGRFRLRSIITGQDLGAFTKSDFVHGIQVKFPGTNTVDILEVTASGS
jgi:alpha-galactosidase